MIMGRPIVKDRNRLRLDGMRHGISPSRPMTSFLVAATTNVTLKLTEPPPYEPETAVP
jgi:hypothetical protein